MTKIQLMMNLIISQFVLLLISKTMSQVTLDKEDYEVSVEQGVLLGKLWTVDGRKVQVFKGVPYAEPPEGERRFKKPMKKQKWQQPELAARTTSRACIQFMDFHINDRFSRKSMKEQGEDCLYLNIYAPFDETLSQIFPVLVWIHGGSYLAGSGDTGIDEEVTIRNLVLRDVILITMNYRLGPLGFLSSGVEESKGNFGLWDQVEALRWIKANVDQFGGNPDSVTVMGESAGAASVSILSLSPVTKDLFHNAIIMSGSSAAGWAVHRAGKVSYDAKTIYEYMSCKRSFNRDDLAHIFRATNVTLDRPGSCNLLDKPLDCQADDEKNMLECLRKADFSDTHFRKALTIELGVSKAVVDGELIPYAIDDLLKNASRIPIMTGIASNEWSHKKPKYYGLGAYKPVNESLAKEKIHGVVQESLRPRLTIVPTNTTMQTLSEMAYIRYIREYSSASEWERSNFLKRLQTLESDIEFVAPCQLEAESYAHSGTPVYLYSFEHVPKSSFLEEDSTWQDIFASFHGLDHAYIFNKGYTNNMDFQYTEEDKQISDLLCNLITNFVKYKNPTPSKIDDTIWLPYTKTDRRYVRIRIPFNMTDGEFYRSHASFWNEFMPVIANRLTTVENEEHLALTEEERIQLAAYKKAWWALWILVAAIAIVLWTIVICLVIQKCVSAKSGPYKNIIVANR